MKEASKDLLVWTGFLFSLGFNIVLVLSFYLTFFGVYNGVSVDSFGEAVPEAILIPVVFGFSCYCFMLCCKKIRIRKKVLI